MRRGFFDGSAWRQTALGLVLGFSACGSVLAAPPQEMTASGMTEVQTPLEHAEVQDDEGLSALPAYIRKRWGVDTERAEEVVAAAQAAAAKVALDPLLLLAIIAKESRFIHFGNPKHLSPDAKGEAVDPLAPHGPMQIAGRWHRDKMPRDSKGRIRPTSVKENIATGALVLREYLEHHGGNLRRALQQYNGCSRRNCEQYPNQVLGMRRDLERAAARRPTP